MKKVLFTILLGLSFSFSDAQTKDELMDQAQAYVDKKDYANAEKITEQLINSNPNSDSNYLYWSNLGTIQRRQGKLKEALNSYNKSIKLNDKVALGFSNRALLYVQLNETEKAIKDFQMALKFEPNNAETLNDFGMLYVKTGDLDKGKALLEKAVSISGHYGAGANLATLKKRQGQYADALKDFNKLIAANPDKALLYNNRADLYLRIKNYDNALSDITKALELDPDYVIAMTTEGEIYFAKGDFEAACKSFQKAISKGFAKEKLAEYLGKCQ